MTDTRAVDHETIATRLAQIVGATHVSSAPADVGAYGGLDPTLVIWPGAASEVARVLKTCTELGVAVGVSAAGTRATRHWPVPGGRLRVALDTRRMLNILEVDELSLTVHSQCGIELRHLEEALNRHGLTLGPYPPAIQRHTLGGLLAAPHPQAQSPRTGWLVDACMAVSAAHADGSVVHTRVAPRRATGPDTSRLYLGSRGSMGVVTTAVLRVHRQPEHEEVVAYALPDFAGAVDAARACLVRGVRPARMRAMEAGQARQELGQTDPQLPAALLAVLSGPAAMVAVEQRLVEETLAELGGTLLSQAVAKRWWARNSVLAELPAAEPRPVPVRLRYSQIREAVQAVPRRVERSPVLAWAEAFSLQGATLWYALGDDPREPAALRSALLDAGLDPRRLNFPPLLDQLRLQLDPEQTLVVMEA